jgi:hypothetical protein
MDVYGFPREVTLERMLESNPIYVGSLTPRALVDEVGGFCPELFGTEDWDLWLRILERGYSVAVIREALAVYRHRSGSVSANLVRMARSRQATYRRALERGALTTQQQRIARRALRLQEAVEQVALAKSEWHKGIRTWTRLSRHLPLFIRVAAENPGRWASGVRLVAGRRTQDHP